ncbi:hypothetical protein [Clostridium beijerinckii]|uniref:hypothetical protein n=1 Tax=Clostridium beijerinckii TaxID=1520 RepID=UPI00098CCDB4|nr:hypothetical protein [Clostridium beijerinckii]NRT78427.1 hypothetical protein [Clostridium beijerinckii]OOM47308.1 ABC-2 family transporter protein [Clostridium beijerinckii]
MYNLIKLEISNCINNFRFKIMFSALLLINIINFLMTCNQYFDLTSNSVPVGYLMGILRGTTARSIFFFFLVTMPLIVSFIYSDSYYMDKKSGVYTSICMRGGRKNYIIAKLIVIGIISFACVFFALFINEFLTFITFNNKGSSMQGVKIYEYESRYSDQEFLSYIEIYKPILYKLILIFVNSLYGSFIAMFTYSISLISKARGISIIALVSIGVFVLDILISKLGLGTKFSMLMYQQGGPGNITCFSILIVIWICLISIIFIMGIKKNVI